jgi:SagB-type dehydrogenase family enzyme
MINKNLIFIFLFLLVQGAFAMTTIQLPKPQINKTMYLDQAIAQRRSVRSFTDKQLSQTQISQLLWAAQGITEQKKGYRAAPSAGAIYPLQLYVVKKDGIWQYQPLQHALQLIIKGDMRDKLAQAALGQSPVKNAPISIVITANYKKITAKYHDRGIMFAHLEAGHAAQNLVLEAVSLGLGGLTVGAFYDKSVARLLNLPRDEDPIYIICIGYKA